MADQTFEERAIARLRADVAEGLRGAGHELAGYNEYGSVVTPGYRVENSNKPDRARVEHKLPEPDLSDPDRASHDERCEARLAAAAAYAATLRAAGFDVIERTVLGNRPILLVGRTDTKRAANA